MKKIFLYIFILSANFLFAQTEGSFMPAAGKYIVSGWVKEEVSGQPVSYSNGKIKIAVVDGENAPAVTYELKPSGAIIDGWQRIVDIIEIPDLSGYSLPRLDIGLYCPGTQDCFFDDIRFYPYNGNLKSFVYDEDSQRLMAELDENNYATFYEYDLEGGLIRVKKETERGVFTIQETRSNNPKQE
ncbi:hypothetical protein [Flavobacterium sp.]|uniref:hypothetical protein n=1 Tax=Flavobacterium sp. TaxID=239 RepID=UPI003D6C64C8